MKKHIKKKAVNVIFFSPKHVEAEQNVSQVNSHVHHLQVDHTSVGVHRP